MGEGEEMNLAQEEAEDAENESEKKKILHALGYFAGRAAVSDGVQRFDCAESSSSRPEEPLETLRYKPRLRNNGSHHALAAQLVLDATPTPSSGTYCSLSRSLSYMCCTASRWKHIDCITAGRDKKETTKKTPLSHYQQAFILHRRNKRHLQREGNFKPVRQ